MIELLDCLTPDECERYREKVHFLRKHWIERFGKDIPFYSLGAASYMDSDEEDDSEYRELVKKMNPILEEHFQPLYRRVAEVLGEKLGKPVQYEQSIAFPGFHIFLYAKIFEQPLASTHFDLQYESINWEKIGEPDTEHPISITLPLALPGNGGGLYYWDIDYEEGGDLPDYALEDLIEKRERKYLEYEVGKMVFHNGRFLHQIAPAKEMAPGDERITLQGHGVPVKGVYRLYW